MLAETQSQTAPPITDIEQLAEDYARFARRTPSEMGICLRSLLQRRDMLTVASAHGQIVTQLLEVDPREGRIVFDWGGVESDNRALLAAPQLYFKGAPEGVRVEFTTGPAQAVSFEGRQAFEVSFPEAVYHVQRREYFRVPAPILDPFFAKGTYPDGDPFHCEVHDISLGGVALRMDTPRLAETEIGTLFTDVLLNLGAGGSLSVDLALVSPRSITTPRGDVRYVVGFRFTRLSGSAESVLQRLITRIEAKRRSLSA
ncbi:flagellar brake protein [Caballeronia sp. LP006]|jgi:c-di-GMP-binding flagellar brake protein YcgR|uniref:flagellar brake protein n=1 Tax=unclassified Caballeronia TaxID=2646786 RepID=UPI002027899E|nr:MULTISPECIES: flagellar brake protein [unclassified Caballeronia]MDR5774803.1 flagellar brake protein [Caballeronia sp. LZ002]MDR5827192.1 flagellar brake protein [Caballeronia sp. LP006]MDR5850239.1 flagellar brake protein [Caballeronia sp. LZ003]